MEEGESLLTTLLRPFANLFQSSATQDTTSEWERTMQRHQTYQRQQERHWEPEPIPVMQTVQTYSTQQRVTMAQETVTKQRNAEQISTLKTTTSPWQFAEVIRKGAQMDLTCVEAVPEALKKLNINIPNLAINVSDESSNTYRCGSRTDLGTVIELDLSNNHFQLRGGPKQGQSSNIRAGDNDCLFESLAQAIPQLLGVSGEEFREKLAECIESNPDIRRHIQLGKHQDLLQRGLFGGDNRGRSVDRDEGRKRRRRSRSPFVHDDPEKETSALEHLLTRFFAIFDMAGAFQRTAEHLGIPRSQVVREGGSEHQDRSSSDARCHAAHVMRIQITDRANAELTGSNAALNEHLITQIGYTELVEKWANMWGGIGQNIDELQALLLKLLEVVDFSQGPPRMMSNYSLEYLQNTVSSLNKLLLRIDPNATPISLPDQGFWASLFTNNEITADTIIEICKDSFAIVLNKWLKAKQKHFMNTDSNKKVLKQMLKVVENSNTSNLLQLGRDAYKKIAQLLSAKPKCGSDKTDKDNDKDNDKGGASSTGNKSSGATVWGSVKETVKTEAASCHVEPSSFLTTALWILLGIAVTVAIGFAIYMAAPVVIKFVSKHAVVYSFTKIIEVTTVVAG
nr:uncharacterized protein LOC109406853 [Aedes albopictus]